jgi:hypothetical protein
LFLLLLLFFETGFLCIALAGLELRNPPASASGVLGLKACATTAQQNYETTNSFNSLGAGKKEKERGW